MGAGGDGAGRIAQVLTWEQMRQREPCVVAAGVYVLWEEKRRVSVIPGSGPEHLDE